MQTGIHGNTREAIQKQVEAKGRSYPISMRLSADPAGGRGSENECDLTSLGQALTTCREHLRAVGVSRVEADHLVAVALGTGAQGAKMSGGGLAV